MLTLHFGVVEMPYEHDSEGKSTGDVAELLEEKYHIFETFFDVNELAVADMITEGMQGQLEDLLAGAPPERDPFAAGCAAVETRFRQFLEREEMAQTATPGVPTKAALRRRSLRFKAKVNPDEAGRPSFIDTGLYEASARVWVTADDA